MTALNLGGMRLLLAGCVSLLLATAPAAERLEFRKPVPDADYEAYVKTLDGARLDVAKALATKSPPYATRVTEVEEGSQAAQAGLAPDWLMVGYNDQPVWEHTQGMEPGGPDGQTRKSVLISPTGETKTINFKPGRIGFFRENWHHPEMFVLQKTPRGAWDRDMLVASAAWPFGRHDITETALAKARDAGMPDNPIERYYSALLAIDRGQDATARSFWDEVMKDIGGKDIPPYYFSGIRTAAWHFRDFGLLRQIVKTEAFLPSRIQPASIDAWAKPGVAASDSLLQLAAQRSGKDLMPTVLSVPDEIWKNWKLIPAEFLHQGWTSMPGTPGKSHSYHFMPKKSVKNALWEITLAVGNAGRPLEALPNSVSFALMDRSQQKGDPRNIDAKRVISFTALEHANGVRLVGFGGGIQEGTLYTERAVPWISDAEGAAITEKVDKQERAALPGPGKAIDLIFVRIDGVAELLVNGQTWAKMPVPDSVQDLGFFVQVVGTVIVVDRMALYSLRD